MSREHDPPHPKRITLGDITRAELTKAVSDPAVPLICAAVLALNTVLFALAGADVVRLALGGGPTRLSDIGALMLAPLYLFLVIPTHLGAGEYPSGQLRVSLAAVPQRGRLVIAKLVTLTAVTTTTAAVTLLPGRLVITTAQSLPADQVVLDVVRWIATYVLMSYVAYALAVLLKNRVTPVAILVLIPIMTATGVIPWAAGIRLLPDQLSLSMLGTPGFDVTAVQPHVAVLLLALWSATLLTIQATVLLKRDA